MKRNIWWDGIMGVVVGDSLGVPVEFKTRKILKANPITDMIGYGTFNLPKGSWSDDSSMTLATLDSLRKGYDLKDIMNKFVKWLLEGEYTPFGNTFDVGMTCSTAIYNYINNKKVFNGGKGENDNGNGSLMRIMPICLYLYEKDIDIKEKIKVIHCTSALTHAHTRSKIACGIYYFIVQSILDNNSEKLITLIQKGIDNAFDFYNKYPKIKEELKYYSRIKNLSVFIKEEEESIDSGGYVVSSLLASVWCLINTSSYKESVLKAVNLGYDTDTTAAITGGLSGLYYGYDNIPENWVEVIKRKDWIINMCNAVYGK